MARGTGTASSPPTATPGPGPLKRSTSSTQNMKSQRSILGFFQKSSPSTPSGTTRNAEPASSPAQRASEHRASSKSTRNAQNLTPVPSSDAVEPEEDELSVKKESFQALSFFPATSTNGAALPQTNADEQKENVSVTPSRRVSR
jgi:DNA mismatch repair protein MSH6